MIYLEGYCIIECDNPFIMKLLFCFQTSSSFYFGLEFASGGTLFNLIKTQKISEDNKKVYLAEIAIGLKEIHDKGFLY
jgi:serine/threonine protein kinase